MPMPARMASCGVRMLTGISVDDDAAMIKVICAEYRARQFSPTSADQSGQPEYLAAVALRD